MNELDELETWVKMLLREYESAAKRPSDYYTGGAEACQRILRRVAEIRKEFEAEETP